MNKRHFLFSLPILLLCPKLACGETVPLQVRAAMYDSANPAPRLYIGKASESLVPLKLIDEGLGEPQKTVVENGNLNLYLTPTINKENPQASIGATAKVPVGQNSLIVIILPTLKDSKTPYRMVLVDDSPKAFPWGESRAVNITPVDFAIEAGEHKLALPAGKITSVPKVTKLDEYNRAQTNFYYKQDGQWVVAAERQMQYVKDLRRVFLIYKEPAALAPDVRTIVDQFQPEPEKTH